MKYADINKRFTEIVSEYICKGYTINAASMSGTQGETAKVDLTNGSEIIRVVVGSFSEYDGHSLHGVEITVGKVTDNVKPNSPDTFRNTIWNQHLEIISTERFYNVGDYRCDNFGTKEQAEKAAEISEERFAMHRMAKAKYVPTAKAMEIAKRIVKRKCGYFNCKRINEEKLTITKDDKTHKYTVCYNGKAYTLR